MLLKIIFSKFWGQALVFCKFSLRFLAAFDGISSEFREIFADNILYIDSRSFGKLVHRLRAKNGAKIPKLDEDRFVCMVRF